MSEHIYEDSDMEHERYHVIPFGSMREEIVRCRDCKHFNEYHGKCHRHSGVLIDDYSTRRFEDLGDVLVLVDAEPDGFCWKGKPQAKL